MLHAIRIVALAAAAASPVLAQKAEPDPAPAKAPAERPSIAESVARASAYLLEHQEGKDASEWPYEGVYRVQRQIPVGYRIGGTAICAMALMRDEGFAASAAATEAVARARAFVIRGIDEPLMSVDDYDAGYDVRGWGYTYGLWFLLACREAEIIPAAERDAAEKAIAFYLDAIHRTEIPQSGGWNYARPSGREKVAPSSPFMTAPTLLTLYKAAALGYEVDAGVVDRALGALERARMASGTVVYSGDKDGGRNGVPGAVGRMLSTEIALYLAGRSTQSNVRGALDAFITHWDRLEERRAKNGTHEGPYAVAPYYFYFAHYWAAQAVELLPERERAEYRRHIHALIERTRSDEGTWNDRVFPRSACYGTAMVSLALTMPDAAPPQGWPATRK